MLLLEVISLFDTLNARFAISDAQQPPSSADRSASTTLADSSQAAKQINLHLTSAITLFVCLLRRSRPAVSDLLTVESTTLQCVQLAITQDSFLSEVLLYIVQTHEIKLSPFSLALLLTMAHIRRHQEATLNALTRCINDQLTAAGKKYEYVGLSPLIDSAAGVLYDRMEQLLIGTAQQSLRMDAIRPYVTALAIRLIDTDCKKDNSDVARLDKSRYNTAAFLLNLVECCCLLINTYLVWCLSQFKCIDSSSLTSSLEWT